MEAWKNAAAMDTKKKNWPEKPSLLPYKKNDDGQIIGKAKPKAHTAPTRLTRRCKWTPGATGCRQTSC
jgi:hypothetical protein